MSLGLRPTDKVGKRLDSKDKFKYKQNNVIVKKYGFV